jgi:hypothetical protein
MQTSVPPKTTEIRKLEPIAAEIMARALALSEFAETLASQDANVMRMRAGLHIVEGEVLAIALLASLRPLIAQGRRRH